MRSSILSSNPGPTGQGGTDAAFWRVALPCRRGSEPAEGGRAGRHPPAERIDRFAHPPCRCAREHVLAPSPGRGSRCTPCAPRSKELLAALASATCAIRRLRSRQTIAPASTGSIWSCTTCSSPSIGYPRVRAMAEGARLSLDRARRLLITPRRHALTFKEHAAIVAAIVAGDPLAARNAMSAHLDSVIGELEDFADEYPALFEGS